MIANLHWVEPKHIAGDESCCLAPITTVLFCHHNCYRLNQYMDVWYSYHRRKMETKGKATVVASGCGENLFNSLPR